MTSTTTAQDRDSLERVKRLFDESRIMTVEARRLSEVDVDYYHGKQYTSEELAMLRKRTQPEIVINRVRAAVNGILGVKAEGKSDPRAWPRTPQDEDSADVASDILRYVAEDQHMDQIKIACFRDMLVPGTMAAITEVDQDYKVTVTQIRWEEFFYDVRSRREDFQDARHMGIAKWRYADDVALEYPEQKQAIANAVETGLGILDTTYVDKPIAQPWIDSKQRRVLVVEMYYRVGAGWKRCVFYTGGVLEEGDSPYTDEKGRTINPIEARSAYVDRDNNRYGIVRDMKGPQDEINKRRSKLLHLLSTTKLQAVDPQAVEVDESKARGEAARADGVIPFGWQIAPTADKVQGQAELLQEAKGEIERLGPNPAILGRQGADASGRSVLARQQAGLTELGILLDGLENWELRIYRQIWQRVKQFWTTEMVIRVTDDEDAPKFISINKPQYGPPQVMQHPETGMAMIGRPVMGYDNPVGEMNVDITLTTQDHVANIQQEQFQDLIQLVGASPLYQQQVPFDILLELSATPHKRQLLDKLKKHAEEQAQVTAQQQQMQQQIAMAGAQAELQKTRSEADLNEARATGEGVKAAVSLHDAHMNALTAAAGLQSGESSAGSSSQQAAAG